MSCSAWYSVCFSDVECCVCISRFQVHYFLKQIIEHNQRQCHRVLKQDDFHFIFLNFLRKYILGFKEMVK